MISGHTEVVSTEKQSVNDESIRYGYDHSRYTVRMSVFADNGFGCKKRNCHAYQQDRPFGMFAGKTGNMICNTS